MFGALLPIALRPRARHRPGCFARLHSRCCGPVSMAPGRRCRDAMGYRDLETLACATLQLVGMRVSFWDLTPWSWLMASAHGAGLMVVPVLLGGKSVFCGAVPSSSSTNSLLSFHPLIAAIAVGVHTISHLVIAGLVAWIVYDFIGLAVLRRSWINLDLIWCFSLLGAAVILFFAPLAYEAVSKSWQLTKSSSQLEPSQRVKVADRSDDGSTLSSL